MADRKMLLAKLDVGDIFHAEAPNGASLICLVVSVSETTLQARRITSQDDLEFNRETGLTQHGSVIDSVASLPAEIHNAFIDLDRKYQQFSLEQEPEQFRLTEAEKKALRFVGPYYSSNPLPAPGT
jgi:hypothetical protein